MSDSGRIGFAEVNGARLYYECFGGGEVVAFLHAGIADSRMWDPQRAAFANAGYQTILYDMRGYGQSEPVEGEYAHHKDLRGVLDLLGGDRAHLVGCSKGGCVALDFALAYPERVASLTLVCSSPHGYAFSDDEPDPPEWPLIVAALEAGDLEKANRLEAQMWAVGQGRYVEEVDPALLEKVVAMNRIALANEAQEIGVERRLEPAAVGRLAEIAAPALVIGGEFDLPTTIEAGRWTADQLGARYVLMAGTAHLPSMEQPEVFNRLVFEFLGEVG
jgi:3-oxoadipate enol-lactonase